MTITRGFFNLPEPGADGSQKLLFLCPGCGMIHAPATGPGAGPRWNWNGSYELPVLTPSLLSTWSTLKKVPDGAYSVEKENICHSFMGHSGAQPGEIIFLSDCTHANAGKVMKLIPFSWD